MSAAMLLDELLAGFAPAASDAWPSPTPAKAARAANRKQTCALAADLTLCEGLRNAANPGTETLVVDANSRGFAALRNLLNDPLSKQPCGFSQDSQDSQGVPDRKASGPDPFAVAWTEGDIDRFLARRARLLRWGWPEPEAEALADRLVRRDRDLDARVSCADCRHYRPGRCSNHRRAGLSTPDVGRVLAGLLQRCPGFKTQETLT